MREIPARVRHLARQAGTLLALNAAPSVEVERLPDFPRDEVRGEQRSDAVSGEEAGGQAERSLLRSRRDRAVVLRQGPLPVLLKRIRPLWPILT
jgi:hypothetical protein